MSGYTEEIRRWAAATSRAGALADPDGTGEVGLGAQEQGRRLAVRFTVRVRDGRLDEARFQVFGCGFTIAACAAAADLASGRPLGEARALDAARIEGHLGGLPDERRYCAELAASALRAAIESADGRSNPVRAAVAAQEGAAAIAPNDPLYRYLMQSPTPPGMSREDRHLFACLLALAAHEPYGAAQSLGLSHADLDALFATCFPGVDRNALSNSADTAPPQRNEQILAILLEHVPRDRRGTDAHLSRWLAHILAARSAHPGHLWRAMGLFERPELSAAIESHLPSLAKANSRRMRWKRFLFKELCNRHGALLCKAPDCGQCSDYPLCFPDQR